jgi:oligoendopeptidase F
MTSTTPFVPENLDCSDITQIEPLYRALLDRPLHSSGDLAQWLADLSELEARFDEFYSRRYIDHTCHTDDAAIEARYMQLVEQVLPKIKPLDFQIKRKYAACAHRAGLDPRRFEVMDRSWQTQVELFRESNIPLQTQATRLTTQYAKILGDMLVEFRGKSYTMQQLARFTEEPDRGTRQEAWELAEARRLRDVEPIHAIFEQLLELRQQMAKNADFADYRAYTWKSRERFDYSPEDCLKFGDAVAQVCLPLVEQLDRQRQATMQVDRLRPWDMAVDVLGRAALRPFDPENIEDFVQRTRQVFHRLSPEMGAQFATLEMGRNLDLQSRKGKRPGGYQSSLEVVKEPFIFMNAAGLQRDVETLLHEGGHALHYLDAATEPLVYLRSAPLEFCEVASMSMELLGSDGFDEYYTAADAARAKRTLLEGIVRILPWIAVIDGYQHWLYTHPGHSRDERMSAWLSILDRFSSKVVDRTGHEAIRAAQWQRQGHLFNSPFYYIEYGIAQLGALQVWRNYRQDRGGTLRKLRGAFALGGKRPLPELFEAAGIRFDFSAGTLRPLVEELRGELEKLPA